ncbi:hypothetical protein BDC45DRAFT_539707 [Circinella umbellata]|nr:hypothetical protein BDC45DRAFT_539707 [Circinella umbellata]
MHKKVLQSQLGKKIKYHPRLVKHFGFINGETQERMWSFLSLLMNMCRNMPPMNKRLTITLYVPIPIIMHVYNHNNKTLLEYSFHAKNLVDVALENYAKTKKARLTRQGVLNIDENHIEVLIVVWFKTFVEYDDTLKSFISKFKQVYKDIMKKIIQNQGQSRYGEIFLEIKISNERHGDWKQSLGRSYELILRLERSPKSMPCASSFSFSSIAGALSIEEKSIPYMVHYSILNTQENFDFLNAKGFFLRSRI